MHLNSITRPARHGTLKEALINHALEAARTGTIESLSLRQASRELGVSPGAVYRHFADKGALRWLSRAQGQGSEYLRRAVQVKNIWAPYGE